MCESHPVETWGTPLAGTKMLLESQGQQAATWAIHDTLPFHISRHVTNNASMPLTLHSLLTFLSLSFLRIFVFVFSCMDYIYSELSKLLFSVQSLLSEVFLQLFKVVLLTLMDCSPCCFVFLKCLPVTRLSWLTFCTFLNMFCLRVKLCQSKNVVNFDWGQMSRTLTLLHSTCQVLYNFFLMKICSRGSLYEEKLFFPFIFYSP